MRRRNVAESRQSSRPGRVRWWMLPLLLVAVASVVIGVLWARGPAGGGAAPPPNGSPVPAAPGDRSLPTPPVPPATGVGEGADGAKPTTEPLLGGFSPVRVLLLNEAAGTFTVEICGLTTQSVIIRWYSLDNPTQLVSQQTVTVPKGKGTFSLKEDLTPTAQTAGAGGSGLGQEVGPGETGDCP